MYPVDLGCIVLIVKAEQDEFPIYEFEFPTSNNRVLLESMKKQLDLG